MSKIKRIPNPNGRPKGSGHKQRLFASIVNPDAEKIVRKGLEMALNGDQKMLSSFLDRLLPKSYDDIPSNIDLPQTLGLNTIKEFAMDILERVSAQELTLEEGKRWFELLKGYRETALLDELDEVARVIKQRHKELKSERLLPEGF